LLISEIPSNIGLPINIRLLMILNLSLTYRAELLKDKLFKGEQNLFRKLAELIGREETEETIWQ